MRGFTLPELLLVLLILGTVAAVSVPRLVDRSAFELPGFQQELASGLRFAQKTAVAWSCPVRVDIADNGFELRRSSSCEAGDFAVALPHPTRGGAFSVTAPGGIVLSPAGSLVFLGDGSASEAMITLVSASGTRRVAVIGATGYVDAL